MNKKKCLGCGSILQSENASKEGFVKLSVYDKSDYCERCFKIQHYGELLEILIVIRFHQLLF